MKQYFGWSALCASLLLMSACGGEKKNAAVESEVDAIAWSDVTKYADISGIAGSKDVKSYNAQGQLAKVETFSIAKEGGAENLTAVVIYKDGKPVLGKEFNEKGVLVGTEVSKYNDLGLLLETTTEALNEEKGKMENRKQYKYTYNDNGDVTFVTEFTNQNLRWVKTYEWRYTYDDQGRFIDRKDYTGDGKEAKQSCWYTYKYADGNKIEQEDYYFFDIKTGKLRHDSKFRYTYNDKNQVVSRLVIRHKNNKKRDDINSRLFTYEYTPAGQLALEMQQRWNSRGNSWYEVSNVRNEYDEQGRIVLRTAVAHTNRGMKVNTEATEYGADSKTAAAPAVPAVNAKPVINLSDKRLTAEEEE